jgi:hypothetical protein
MSTNKDSSNINNITLSHSDKEQLNENDKLKSFIKFLHDKYSESHNDYINHLVDSGEGYHNKYWKEVKKQKIIKEKYDYFYPNVTRFSSSSIYPNFIILFLISLYFDILLNTIFEEFILITLVLLLNFNFNLADFDFCLLPIQYILLLSRLI